VYPSKQTTSQTQRKLAQRRYYSRYYLNGQWHTRYQHMFGESNTGSFTFLLEKLNSILVRCESNTGAFMLRTGNATSSLLLLFFFSGPRAVVSSTCEEEFTGGLSWPAWAEEQGYLPPEDRCASYREDECTCPNPFNPNDYSRARLPVPLPDTIKQILWKKQHR
jgi:hypothetical protein